MAGGIPILREGRRRAALNESMHELRRPLQALALTLPRESTEGGAAESSLRMAVAATERLDCEINGKPPPRAGGPARARAVVESAVERWGTGAFPVGTSIGLRWAAGEGLLDLDEVELSRAVDNLISNGLEHGSGEVAIEVTEVGCRLRLVVRNPCPDVMPGARRRRPGPLARLAGRNRHGHGLRIVRRIAADNGGGFGFRRVGDGCEARLDLPLAAAGR
jgi:signal transduction histidine kinase